MSYLNNFFHHFYGPEEGRKWLFVHGLMGYGQNWRRIIADLEKTERCLAFDQRGHGRSFQPPSGYAPEDYADDIKKIVDELGWEKFVLVGHSMGGRNVLNFGARYPDRLSHLIVEDIGPEAAVRAHEYYEYLLNLVPVPFASREEAKRFFFGDFVKMAETRENVQVMANFFYSNMVEQADGTVNWRFSKNAIIESVRAGREDERWQEVKDLKVPTLWVRGANSKELSAESFRRVLACNSMIKGVEIPQAGHWVHSDQAEAFVTAIKAFVGGFE